MTTVTPSPTPICGPGNYLPGHNHSLLPYIAEGGWDARQVECFDCQSTWSEVRAMPAEGCLIDCDPHLASR